jgi:hypothetical protein
MSLSSMTHGLYRLITGWNSLQRAHAARAGRGVAALSGRLVSGIMLLRVGAVVVTAAGGLLVAQGGGVAQAQTKATPSYTQIVYRWTVISHGLSSSGTGTWNAYGWYDYREAGASDGVSLSLGSSTSNTWSGTLGVSLSVLDVTLGLSASHSIGHTFSITYSGDWPNAKKDKYVGYTEYTLTTQTYKITQQKWECVQRNGTNLCAEHWPEKWEKDGTATVYVNEHSPTVRFYHCKHNPRVGQQCAANTG